MIYADDSIHDAIEKLAFLGSASKPFHEMSNKEIKKHRRNWEEERKTPETKIFRGISHGASGATGGALGAMAGASGAPGSRLKAAEFALKHAIRDQEQWGSKLHDPYGDKLKKVKSLEESVAKLKKVVSKAGPSVGRQAVVGGALGAAALGGTSYGLTQLSDFLGRRRLKREFKRRDMPKGSWKKASVNGTDGIHEGIEKVANVQRVKRFLAQGLSLDDAIEKAYPKMTPFNRQQMAKQLKRAL